MQTTTARHARRPLGAGPGIFGQFGEELRVVTPAGAFWFTYASEEDAHRVVSLLRERIGGNAPAAARLRGAFTWPNVMAFLGECFEADIPLLGWRAGSWPHRSKRRRR